jgi:hypothetical protein
MALPIKSEECLQVLGYRIFAEPLLRLCALKIHDAAIPFMKMLHAIFHWALIGPYFINATRK